MTHTTFVFAGGGSGGHISPGLAVAERLVELKPATRVLFLCSGRDVDRVMLSEAEVCFEPIPGAPFSLRPRGFARFARSFFRSRREARRVLARHVATRVVALGGFVAAPVVAAAHDEGAPVTLLNLDDPPGKANRWIARRSDQVLSAIETPGRPGFAQRITGMPVRRAALATAGPRECRRRLGLDPDMPTLLVTGASQGSMSINALLAVMLQRNTRAFEGWQVLHLTGSADEQSIRGAYAAAGVPAVVRPFVHQMGPAWGAADLAVSRAGASSVAEAWINAAPTIFLPYPYHRDHHQHRNAAPMAAAGGAVIETDHVETGANLRGAGAAIGELMLDEPRRRLMKECLGGHPAPDGADVVARLLLNETAGA